MKRRGVGSTILAAILSLALLVACSNNAGDTKNAETSSPADEAASTSIDETRGDDVSGEKVFHRMAIGETVDIHGILVTVTSATDGTMAVDGKPTFVIHVKCEAVPDPSYYSAEGTSFSPKDWALEYTSGERYGEIATVGAAALGSVMLKTGQNVEGDVYFVRKGNVAKIVYTPALFDWYPEVTTWGVR